MASMGGHSEVIAWLLAKQAPVETTSRASEANAALYAAVRGGHAEAVSRLLTGASRASRAECGGVEVEGIYSVWTLRMSLTRL